MTPFGQHGADGVHVQPNVAQEHKAEDEPVSLVMNMVQHALDPLQKHDLVREWQWLTRNGQPMEPGVHVLQNVEQEHKREHVLVSRVMLAVKHALVQLLRHDRVLERAVQ